MTKHLTEIEVITKQIQELKIKLKAAKKRESDAHKNKILKLLEEGGVLELDEKAVLALIKNAKYGQQPVKPADPAST